MHKNNFVVAVQDSNGNTLRERDDEIRLPFGSEYKIYLKNQESRKASVTVSINGKDILGGNSIIVNPNNSAVLDGFMKGNVITHRFKFIQKTEQIAQHTGDNPEDGFIRVEVQLEKPKPIQVQYHIQHHSWYCSYCGCDPCRCNNKYGIYTSCGDYIEREATIGSSNTAVYSKSETIGSSIRQKSQRIQPDTSRRIQIQPEADEGLTVPGSEKYESLDYATIGVLELNKTVFTFRMLGINDNGYTPIQNPVVTRANRQCITCGNYNPTTARFCSECGTSLTY